MFESNAEKWAECIFGKAELGDKRRTKRLVTFAADMADGTQVEKLRMQTRADMERMSTILAFVAIRLMQLKELAENKEEAKKQSCERMFRALEWRMLWSKVEKKALSEKAPSIFWSYFKTPRFWLFKNVYRIS